MKKLFTTALFFAATFVVNAQSELTFKSFKVDISSGIGVSFSPARYGRLLAIEPKYSINDNFTFGVKGEVLAVNDSYGDPTKGLVSYMATADYFLNTNEWRPFAGLGFGVYQAYSDKNSAGYNKFGLSPRAGIEHGHGRIAIEYNVAGNADGETNNYISLKAGFFLGGGRRD